LRKLLEAMRECRLDLEVISNKGSVMALPAGVTKATGLLGALREMQIAAQDLVAVGDAENDIAMLELAGLGVAVAGALEPVKQSADMVTSADAGEGVIELIERLLADGLTKAGEKSDTLCVAE
jgi:hydroxymethylpyrimidine pyrophosphatase-like HAD family hydrolase